MLVLMLMFVIVMLITNHGDGDGDVNVGDDGVVYNDVDVGVDVEGCVDVVGVDVDVADV